MYNGNDEGRGCGLAEWILLTTSGRCDEAVKVVRGDGD